MFGRRNRSTLSDTLREAYDPELRSLRAEVSERQEAIAELELELFDLRVSLEEFERKLEIRIRPLERQLEELKAELNASRHRAERRAQWGSQSDLEQAPDVVGQFKRAWTPREPRVDATKVREAPQPDDSQLKTLYRALAKRYHPDLTTDPEQKLWRQNMMAKVNTAYQSKNLNALRALENEPDRPPQKVVKSREQKMADLAAEVLRLDAVIAKLRRELDELSGSDLAQVQLDSSMARLAGHDLLGQIARELEIEIAQVKAELASLH